jgi:high-affinity iron transporter
MSFRDKLGRAAAAFLTAAGLGLPHLLVAQESPARRVANIVSVAVEEYRKGVDESGRLISRDEYDEAVDFLKDARTTAARLPGDRVAAATTLLDSIMAAIQAKKPPSALAALNQRFAAALGSEAALELPRKPIDLADGGRVYAANCASCHGLRGMGDGPAGAALSPKPPAIGNAKAMHDVAPAMMFRKISVGVAGTAMAGFAQTLTAEQRWNVVMYLSALHSAPEQVAEGEGLFTQSCVECHGATGMGDATLGRSLSKLPGEIGSFAWQVARSDSQLAAVVRAGMPGTPMPPAPHLDEMQVQSVVAYLRSLPMRERVVAAVPAVQHDSSGAAAAAAASMTLLDQSLTAARNGRSGEASDRAFDAYLAFEPIETPARARNPGVVSTMEKHFADFKGAIRGNDLGSAERARDAIEANMQRVVDLTRPPGSGSEAFWQSFLIILREGFEAILVIGAVVAFLLKTGHRERLRSIWFGIALALGCSALTAIVLRTVLKALPATQELIEGGTLLVAVVVLFTVSYWLISRVEAAKWQAFIREKVTDALEHGGGRALAFVAFLAVYREGAETALFYQALFNEGAHVALPITLGIVIGFVALAIIFTLFYRFGVRIPLRTFFSVTSVLLYYMAFVFMGKGVRELQEGNVVPISAIRGLPSIEALGFYPTWQTLLAQLLLLGLFAFAVAKTFWPKRSVTLPTINSPAPAPAPATTAAPAASEREVNRLREEIEALNARIVSLEEALRARISESTEHFDRSR